MPIDPIFQRVFKKIYGKPCWRVSPGYGSFLTMEFGEPHLDIREPRSPKGSFSPRVKRLLESRLVFIHGQWHLWVYCCNWKVLLERKLIGDGSSKRSMQKAADFLDGQKLIQFSISAKQSRCRFTFDLGGVLETWPYDDDSEQWFFFDDSLSHKVFTLRADAHYSYGPSNSTESKEWKPVQIS